MNRRDFFATLLAPYLARFAPKPAPALTVYQEVEAKMAAACLAMEEQLVRDFYLNGCAVGTGYWNTAMEGWLSADV